jgi:restriction endonuclease S subunit
MISFNLSNNTNKEKVFLRKLSQIEGRLDPHPYHPERLITLKKLSKIDCERLKDVVVSNKQIATDITENDIYIGLENIISNTGEYVPTIDKISISSAAVFKKGQILFPKLRPYLNKVYFADFDGLCSTEFHVFNSLNIKPEFLTIYLRSSLVVSQTKHLMTGNTLPRLQTEDIYKIPVPKICLKKQDEITNLYQAANNIKLQKESQAKKLQESIGNYLLAELNIIVDKRNNTLENRIFKTTLKQVSEKRYDCDYYSTYYSDLEICIDKGKFPTIKIDFIASYINSGKTPASSEYSVEQTNYPIIKVGSYTNEFIDLNKVDFTFNFNQYVVHKDDIFILSAAHQAEYVGRHIKFLDSEPSVPTSYVGELICIRANNLKCNPMYLFSILSTDLFKTLINREKTGQTSHIYSKDIKNLRIPLPPLLKQKEIADHIIKIRNEIKELQDEATKILDTAKKQVEKMIFT